MRSVPKDPYSRLACALTAPAPRRVMTFTTPASASLPHSELCGPRTISTRSMSSVVRCAKSKASSRETSFASMPSISTRTWFASAPRTRNCVTLPAPPKRPTANPGTSRSRSVRKAGLRRSMSSRVITVTLAPALRSAIGVRDAVTMTSSRAEGLRSPAWAPVTAQQRARQIGVTGRMRFSTSALTRAAYWSRGERHGRHRRQATPDQPESSHRDSGLKRQRPVSGLAKDALCSSGVWFPAFPCMPAQWLGGSPLRLPLRGQRRPCFDFETHRLPDYPEDWTVPRHRWQV